MWKRYIYLIIGQILNDYEFMSISNIFSILRVVAQNNDVFYLYRIAENKIKATKTLFKSCFPILGYMCLDMFWEVI